VAASDTTGADSELASYLADLENVAQDTDPIQYWIDREEKYRSIGVGLGPGCCACITGVCRRAYVERVFFCVGI